MNPEWGDIVPWSIETVMLLSLLVWETDFLDQSVSRVFDNKRQKSRKPLPELISSVSVTARSAEKHRITFSSVFESRTHCENLFKQLQ